MSLIVALSEQIQKLLNERASSAVLREHLALFKDRAVDLEKRTAMLTSENEILKTENADLKMKSEQLTKDNAELKKKIQDYEQLDENNFKNSEWKPLDPEAGY